MRALVLLDADQQAGAVDVADIEVDDLRGPKAAAIGDTERGLVLEAPSRPIELAAPQPSGGIFRFRPSCRQAASQLIVLALLSEPRYSFGGGIA